MPTDSNGHPSLTAFPDLAPAAQVHAALRRVIDHLILRDDARSELLELPPLQIMCLQAVTGHEDQRLADLAGRMEISLSVASRLVDRLVRQGLLDRRADARDRRAVRLRPTERARTLVTQLEAKRLARIADCLDSLHGSERDALVQGLTAFADAAAALPNPPALRYDSPDS